MMFFHYTLASWKTATSRGYGKNIKTCEEKCDPKLSTIKTTGPSKSTVDGTNCLENKTTIHGKDLPLALP